MRGGVENREDRGDKAENRTNGEIKLLVDDDKSHADSHHTDTCRIAQERRERIGRAEKSRINENARAIDQAHKNEDSHLPTAK